MEKCTRNFSVIEIVNPKFLNIDNLFSNIENLDKAKINDVLWYNKILQPINSYSENKKNRNKRSISSKTCTKKYTNVYKYFDNTYRESIEVKHIIEGAPPYTSEQFAAQIKIAKSYTTCDEHPDYNHNYSHLRIGQTNPTIITAHIDGDKYGFRGVQIDGEANKKGNLRIDLDIGYGKGVFGASIKYEKSKTVDLNENYEIHLNETSIDKYAKEIKSTFDDDYNLEEPEHYFAASYNVGRYDGASSKLKFLVDFSYSVYNGWNVKSNEHTVSLEKTFY